MSAKPQPGKSPAKLPKLESVEEVEKALQSFAQESNEATGYKNRLEKILTRARAKYEPLISMAEKSAGAIEKQLEKWAAGNPVLFKEKRSADFTHGTIGYHTGNRTVKTLAKITFEMVLQKLRAIRRFKIYVRWTPTINREKILEDSKAPAAPPDTKPVDPKLSETDLKEMGVRVDQKDAFYVELKKG